ncbi:vacuolar protein sorting-associated protein 41 [Pelomyxa schiedti]|nr:vacuolar protein sorting-associated protein 41 [Pelomyxa schiedti]
MAGAPETGRLEDLLGSVDLTGLPAIVIESSAPTRTPTATTTTTATTSSNSALGGGATSIGGVGDVTSSIAAGLGQFSFFGYDDNNTKELSASSAMNFGKKIASSVRERRQALDRHIKPLSRLPHLKTKGLDDDEEGVLTLPPKSTFYGDPKALAKAKVKLQERYPPEDVPVQKGGYGYDSDEGSESEPDADDVTENEEETEDLAHFDPVELESDLEEEIEGKEEPQLKYKRMEGAGAIPTFLLQHPHPSCLSYNAEFLVIGCTDGTIAHIHPLSGGLLKLYNPNPHPVNCVCAEHSGTCVASCYSDGKIIVSSGEPPDMKTITTDVHKPVSFVAINPQFSAHKVGTSSKQVCFATATSVVIREIRRVAGMKRTRDKVLSESTDPVLALNWRGRHIVYATTKKLIVFNSQVNLTMFSHFFPSPCTTCCVSWENESTLVVNHDRTVMKVRLDKNGKNEASMFKTNNMATRAIAPFGNFFISLRAIDSENPYPLLCVLNTRGEELNADALPVSAIDTLKPEHILFDFTLNPEPTFYIVTPNEILIASKCDDDDHIDYLLRAHRFYEALRDIDINETQVTKWNLKDVGELYMSKLIEKNKLKRAASMCPLVLRQDKKDWEKWTQRFEELGALNELARYLPTDNPVLDSVYYELVLNSLISNADLSNFLSAIKKWPPTVYNINSVTELINRELEHAADSKILLQALAEIYSKTNEHDKALLVFLKAGQGPIFQHIEKYQLFKSVESQITSLFSINSDKTIRLLVKHADKLNVRQIAPQLSKEEFHPYLLKYLHQLHVRYGTTYDPGPEIAKLQVELYAQYISKNYPPQEALPPTPTSDLTGSAVSNQPEALKQATPTGNDLTVTSSSSPKKISKKTLALRAFSDILGGSSAETIAAATSVLSAPSVNTFQSPSVVSVEDILSASGGDDSVSAALKPIDDTEVPPGQRDLKQTTGGISETESENAQEPPNENQHENPSASTPRDQSKDSLHTPPDMLEKSPSSSQPSVINETDSNNTASSVTSSPATATAPKKEYGRHSLIRFLRVNNFYPTDACAEVCGVYKLHKEQAFIYAKSGALNKALHIYMTALADIKHAMRFVKKHNDGKLWDDLVKHAIMAPPQYNYIHVLLMNMGVAFVNPISLIRNIPKGMKIDGIHPAIIKLFSDHSTEEFLRRSGNMVLRDDSVILFRRLFTLLRRGRWMNMTVKCLGCATQIIQSRGNENFVFFYCGHATHLRCLAQAASAVARGEILQLRESEQQQQSNDTQADQQEDDFSTAPQQSTTRREVRKCWVPLVAGTRRRFNCPLCTSVTQQKRMEDQLARND